MKTFEIGAIELGVRYYLDLDFVLYRSVDVSYDRVMGRVYVTVELDTGRKIQTYYGYPSESMNITKYVSDDLKGMLELEDSLRTKYEGVGDADN